MASRRIDLRTLRFARALLPPQIRPRSTMVTTWTAAATVGANAFLSHTRSFSSPSSSPFDNRPAPPRLPPDEQAEFERLLREAAESVAAAELADSVRQAVGRDGELGSSQETLEAYQTQKNQKSKNTAQETEAAAAAPAGTSGNPIEGVWRGAPPEFEGDRNPVTGEVGGPKNEPLRWGSSGDWSFNGRVTDF